MSIIMQEVVISANGCKKVNLKKYVYMRYIFGKYNKLLSRNMIKCAVPK